MSRHAVSQTLGGQCGVQPWSKTTFAGELAKRESPRPQAPLRPNKEASVGRRSGEYDCSAAMRPFRPSRPGSAQGNHSLSEETKQARRGKGLYSKVLCLEDAIASLSQELSKLGEHLMRATCLAGEPTGHIRSAALSRQGNNMIDPSAALSRQANNMIDPLARAAQPVFHMQCHYRGVSEPSTRESRRARERERERRRRRASTALSSMGSRFGR